MYQAARYSLESIYQVVDPAKILKNFFQTLNPECDFYLYEKHFEYSMINTYRMVRKVVPNLQPVSRFDRFLSRALTDITGEEISVRTISENRDVISCISQNLERETGLDSCDIARWISKSLKEYAETELTTWK